MWRQSNEFMKVGLGCGRWGGKMNRRGSALESFRGSCDSLWQIKWIICYTVMTRAVKHARYPQLHACMNSHTVKHLSFQQRKCICLVLTDWLPPVCVCALMRCHLHWTLKALSMTHTDLSRWDRCRYNILSRARARLLIYFM